MQRTPPHPVDPNKPSPLGKGKRRKAAPAGVLIVSLWPLRIAGGPRPAPGRSRAAARVSMPATKA